MRRSRLQLATVGTSFQTAFLTDDSFNSRAPPALLPASGVFQNHLDGLNAPIDAPMGRDLALGYEGEAGVERLPNESHDQFEATPAKLGYAAEQLATGGVHHNEETPAGHGQSLGSGVGDAFVQELIHAPANGDYASAGISRKGSLSTLTTTVRGWGSAQPVAKVAAKLANISLGSRRGSLRERRRSQQTGRASRPPCDCESAAVEAQTTMHQKTAEELASRVLASKMSEVMVPLQNEMKKLAFQQAEGMATMKDVWTEVKNISRRISQLDGKWM